MPNISPATLIGIFDRVGIVAFAVGGVEAGVRRRLDLFGLLVMGVVAATGGGLLRDVMLGDVPRVLARGDYLGLAAGASFLAIPLATRDIRGLRLLLGLARTVGLGAFSAAGAVAAMRAGLPLPAVLALAIVTATGGGVLRDLLADRVPLVLHAEINATAAAAGGLVVWAMDPVWSDLAGLAGAIVAGAVGLAGATLGLHLPAPGGRHAEE